MKWCFMMQFRATGQKNSYAGAPLYFNDQTFVGEWALG